MSEQIDDIEIQIRIDNASGSLSKIILEPWAVEVEIKKGDRVSLLASGPPEHAEFDQAIRNDSLIIYAGHGWTVAVSVNDQPVFTGSEGFPAL